MTIAGLIGLGVVWGWWTAPWLELRARARAAALVVTAAVLQGIQAASIVGLRHLIWLFAGWAGGWFVHSVFRAAVRTRAPEL